MKNEKEKKKRKSFKDIIQGIWPAIKLVVKEIRFLFKFLILLFFVFFKYLLERSTRKRLNKPKLQKANGKGTLKRMYDKVYIRVLKVFDKADPQEVRSSDLIFLAMRNLSAKKSRTYMTIGGMAIGFGAVILLLSAGYGFERLVISQIASLSEMQQIDISISQGSPLVFNPEVISNISGLEKVKSVIPIVTSVSKVTYNNAVSDVIVYGVPNEYFEEMGMEPLIGKLYENQVPELQGEKTEDEKGVVAGVSSFLINSKSLGEEIYEVKYSINPTIWKAVYSEPSTDSKILGYTKREAGKQEATEVWGDRYKGKNEKEAVDITGREYSAWVKDTFSLADKNKCKMTNPDCIDGGYIVQREVEGQAIKLGYITEDDVAVERYELSRGSALEVYSGKIIDDITFGFREGDYTNMYFDTDEDSTLVTVRNEDVLSQYDGQLIYDKFYENSEGYFIKSSNGKNYGYWIKASINLWGENACEKICEVYYTSKQTDSDVLKTLSVYLRASDLVFSESTEELLFSNVLGTETSTEAGSFVDLETLMETDDTIDWVTIASELGTTEKIDKEVKSIPDNAQKVALVNSSMLTLLGIDSDKAIDEEFEATLIFDSKLFDRANYIVESEPTSFRIKGVISDSKTPTFYLPYDDIKVEGMNNVSSLKVVVDDTQAVEGVRTSIEAFGFQTNSVVDTVDSISNLFGTLRIALLILGLIALGVASLGMFNTLTVSLLEKTREVGLLKTMGLKSDEVKTLFLAESLIMSVMGGVAGLLLGFLVGKLLSLLISLLALSQGQGIIDVTYIPFLLGFGLVFLSAVVGVITGWYPAERAKKVSALNALRYE